MLAGIVVLTAIVLATVAPPAHGAPCPHSQQEEGSAPQPQQATPGCCRGSRLAIPQCGRNSMAGGPVALAPLPRGGCSLCTAFAALRVRTAGLALPWTPFHARSMRALL